jgi:hypothetical protein
VCCANQVVSEAIAKKDASLLILKAKYGTDTGPLHRACELRWMRGVETLLKCALDVDELDTSGCTPLIVAAQALCSAKNDREGLAAMVIIDMLLEAHADTQISRCKGEDGAYMTAFDVCNEALKGETVLCENNIERCGRGLEAERTSESVHSLLFEM